MLLCGCATDDRVATYSAGDGRLAVALPIECEAFLQPVPVPKVTAKTDARVAFVKVDAALGTANGRLAGGRDCAIDQRKGFAGKPAKRKGAGHDARR